MNYVLAYWEAIESGKETVGRRVRAVYRRIVKEIREPNPDSPYYFDEEAGARPIEFAERFCKQSQGVIGAPLVLELFQKAYIQVLFGFLEKATGYRRYRETMFLVGRKNGKSTLLAAIALYMLIADYEGAAEIYSVATKKDQAKKVLTEAINMVKQSPELRAVLRKRRNDLYFPATASTLEALASDSNTLDGLNSHAVIIDELHAIKDRNLYEVMKQSTSSRRQPMVVMITTAGTVRESVFDNLYELAAAIADGEKQDDTFLPILYELDERAEWTDPTKWKKANPGLGTIKKYKTLASFVERAKINPDDLPGVLCKDFILPVFDGGKLSALYPINAHRVDLVEHMGGMYYSAAGGVDWLLVTAGQYTGYVSAAYLRAEAVPPVDSSNDINTKEDDGMAVVYQRLGDVADSYKPTIRKLMERGALKGYSDPDPNSLEDNILNVSEDYCRVMTTLDRMGKLD